MKARIDFADVPAGLPEHSIVIRDIGVQDGHASISSDAESVVATVLRIAAKLNEPISPNSPPIYYYDETEQLAQLCHDGTSFVSFGSPSHGRN